MWEYIASCLVLLWAFITESGATYCEGTYCVGSCCGVYTKYCCSSSYSYGYYSYDISYSYRISSGGIAGVVIGVLTTIGIIIGIIVCVSMRRNRTPGQIIMTTPTNNTVIATTTGLTQMYPGGVQPYAVPPQYQYNQAGYRPNQAPGIMPSGGQFPYGEQPSYGRQFPYSKQPSYDGQFPYSEQPSYDGQFPNDGEQPPSAPPPYDEQPPSAPPPYDEQSPQPEPSAHEIS